MNEQIVYYDIEILKQIIDKKNILIVHGNSSYKKNNMEKFFCELNNNIAYEIIVGESNPKEEILSKDYCSLAKIYYDCIVAIGGGSIIDTAKYVLYREINNHKYKRENIKFIAIPTTAGSGSEATPFAVYYNSNKEKCSIDEEYLLPDYVILEHNLIKSMTRYQKACSVADAFCQALESFWSIKSNEQSKEYSKASLSLFNKILPDYVNLNNQYMKEAMLASYLAGKAIAISRTTLPHALSYEMTSKWDIPHGHAVSLTISECLLMNENYMSESEKKVLCDIFGLKDIYSLKKHIDELLNNLGLERRLHNLGIKSEDIDMIIKKVNVSRLSNNPYIPKYNELYEIFMRIL